MAFLKMVRHRFYNNDGTVAAGGKVYTYEPGTSTAKNSYTDHTGATANAWPLILDSKGEGDYWVDDSFKINVLQSDDVQITGYPVDYVPINETSNLYPNGIINGNFKIAQAGTSFAAPASGAYDLDGWYTSYVSAAVFTVAQVAGSSAGVYARRVTVTTADASVAAGDRVTHVTKLLGYDCVKYLSNTFTIGFWVKSSVIGTHCVAIYNGTSTYVAEYTISVADTFEYKTITIIGGTPLLSSSNTGYGFSISWTNLSGSTFQTTAGAWNTGNFTCTANQVNDLATIGNIFELQDVTINPGTAVATIERSYGEELAACQRYYITLPVFVGVIGAQTTIPISMRDTPTISGGGVGFTSTGTTKYAVVCYQTAAALQTIVLASRL